MLIAAINNQVPATLQREALAGKAAAVLILRASHLAGRRFHRHRDVHAHEAQLLWNPQHTTQRVRAVSWGFLNSWNEGTNQKQEGSRTNFHILQPTLMLNHRPVLFCFKKKKKHIVDDDDVCCILYLQAAAKGL